MYCEKEMTTIGVTLAPTVPHRAFLRADFSGKKSREKLMPNRAHPLDAGWDVRADLDAPHLVIEPFGRAAVPTGLCLTIPAGYEVQVRPKSGLFIHKGLTVGNAPGTIDAGYQGEVMVLLLNTTPNPVVVLSGSKIAQLVPRALAPVDFPSVFTDVATSAVPSSRGTGGMGSTGE